MDVPGLQGEEAPCPNDVHRLLEEKDLPEQESEEYIAKYDPQTGTSSLLLEEPSLRPAKRARATPRASPSKPPSSLMTVSTGNLCRSASAAVEPAPLARTVSQELVAGLNGRDARGIASSLQHTLRQELQSLLEVGDGEEEIRRLAHYAVMLCALKRTPSEMIENLKPLLQGRTEAFVCKVQEHLARLRGNGDPVPVHDEEQEDHMPSAPASASNAVPQGRCSTQSREVSSARAASGPLLNSVIAQELLGDMELQGAARDLQDILVDDLESALEDRESPAAQELSAVAQRAVACLALQRPQADLIAELKPLLQSRAESFVHKVQAQQSQIITQLAQPREQAGGSARPARWLHDRLRIEPSKIAFDPPDPDHPSNVLGSGGFGVVHRAHFCEQIVAVKKVNFQAVAEPEAVGAVLLKELEELTFLSCPQILCYMGFSQDTGSLSSVSLVMEYMTKGSIWELLGREGGLSMALRLRMLHDGALGMHYLHERGDGICHRDLKSHNLLVSGEYRVKLADFGLSRLRNCALGGKDGAAVGTLRWMAPELLGCGRVIRLQATDVFAFGVVLWEVTTLWDGRSDDQYRLPYWSPEGALHIADEKVPEFIISDENNRESLDKLDAPHYSYLKKLIMQCWRGEPTRRPRSKRVVKVLDALKGWLR